MWKGQHTETGEGEGIQKDTRGALDHRNFGDGKWGWGNGGGQGGWLAKHMDGAGTFYSWESRSYYLRLKRRLKRSGRATRFPNSAASPVLQK